MKTSHAVKTEDAGGTTGVNMWRATFSGLCATLIGIGLSRFAYTPLIPALVEAQWFTPSQAAYLGAANLAGYLAGVLLARPAAARTSATSVLRIMMAVGALTFFACAYPGSFSWFFFWRFVSGASGGALMVLAAPTVLPHVPASRRGLAGGIIFTGVGAGAALSGLVMPLLLESGVVGAWLGLGVFSLVLTVISWGGWPTPAAVETGRVQRTAPPEPVRSSLALNGLYVEYGLGAIGLVPHMVFLVDFVARGLGQGVDIGAHYWVLFGIGAAIGPVTAGHVADRIGFSPALRAGFVVQAGAVGLLMFASTPVALTVSSVIVGAFVPGFVTLVLGRSRELVHGGPDAQGRAWSLCTTAFALGQAAGGYGFSYLFKVTGGEYFVLFELGAATFVVALFIDLIVTAVDSRATKARAEIGHIVHETAREAGSDAVQSGSDTAR